MNKTGSTTIEEFVGNRKSSDYEKYPNYRPSDLDWINEIPEDWTTLKLRWACDFITDGSHHSPSADENGNKIYITVSDISAGEED